MIEVLRRQGIKTSRHSSCTASKLNPDQEMDNSTNSGVPLLIETKPRTKVPGILGNARHRQQKTAVRHSSFICASNDIKEFERLSNLESLDRKTGQKTKALFSSHLNNRWTSITKLLTQESEVPDATLFRQQFSILIN